MAHTHTSCLFHVVFSTHQRTPALVARLRERLWSFLGGIARKNGLRAISVGGTADHVHLLLSIPATMPLSKAVQLLKGGSSKWVHDTFPEHRRFAWQEGYGAFTVSVSHEDATIAYIRDQERHHRRKSFQEEFLSFLKKHRIEYDPRHVWG